jgi:large subunit ribosomal protein L25
MTHSKLAVNKRTLLGNQAKKLHREGLTSGIVYGNIKEPIAIQFLVGEFAKLYKIAGENHVVDLEIDGKTIPAIIHDLDINPVTRKLRNVDFKAVDLKKETTAYIPVKLEGIAPVVKNFSGLVSIKISELEVSALPEKLPEVIIIDISKLETLDDNIFVKDIISTGEFKILDDPELPVVVVETESKEEEVETTPVETAESTTAETK